MFVSIDLAARIDRTEARLSASLGRALLANKVRSGILVEEIGGGVAVFASPSSPMNKMIGVGFGPLPAADHLHAKEQFSARGAPLQAEVSTLADPAFPRILTRRGYVLQGFENVLGRPLAGGDGVDVRRETDIAIDVMADAEHPRWLAVTVASFLEPDEQGVRPEPMPARDAPRIPPTWCPERPAAAAPGRRLTRRL